MAGSARDTNPPLSSWTCDSCGEPVNVEDGYVIWRTAAHKAWGFKIIHRGRCDDKACQSSLALEDLLGPIGLVRLTSFLDVGEFHAPDFNDRSPEDIRVRDMAEFVVLFRRLHVPFYEEARSRFHLTLFQEEMDGVNEVRVYQRDILERAARGEFDED